ncbi:hypothetical protein BRADI_1g26463v3 [Brachypodium distachyon]|uniref:Uncharacterized protein n=1 Tax=Brachypodium distachyon TaxID=15368 RepID=A0A2K2DL86_BRADI|nr:hypothetical protein BRADI_1g26463v3 [Brachypodium distachyon]
MCVYTSKHSMHAEWPAPINWERRECSLSTQ